MQQSKQRLDTHNKGISTKAPSLVGFTPTHEHQIHLPWSWAQTKHLDNTHVVWLWHVNSVLFLLHVKSVLQLPFFTQVTFKTTDWRGSISHRVIPHPVRCCPAQSWLHTVENN